jgi:hypothetical protein
MTYYTNAAFDNLRIMPMGDLNYGQDFFDE